MEPKPTANRLRAQAGALQQRRRGDRARGGHHRATAHDQGEGRHLRLPDGRANTDRAAIFDQHAINRAVDDDPGALPVSVHQVSLQCRLLGPDLAAVTAKPAALVLSATLDIARHIADMPAELAEATLQHPFAGTDPAMTDVDAEPLVHRVQRRGVLIGRKGPESVSLRPFVAEPVGTPKARGVVDDRAATQTAAG